MRLNNCLRLLVHVYKEIADELDLEVILFELTMHARNTSVVFDLFSLDQ